MIERLIRKVRYRIEERTLRAILQSIWQPESHESAEVSIRKLCARALKGSNLAAVELMRIQKFELLFPAIREEDRDRILASVAREGDSEAALDLADMRLRTDPTNKAAVLEALEFVKQKSPRAEALRAVVLNECWPS